MSVKCAFFGIFQKLTLFCCAMFFGFTNAFSANLPSGYTELEYIESSGTQYIDTGYKPKTGDKIRIVYQYNSLYGGDDGRDATSIFGCTDGASAANAFNGVARVVQGTSTINRIAWGNGTNSIIGNLTYNNATGVWYDLVCDNGVFTINDTQLGTTSANSFSANFSMYLFARNTGGTAGLITKGKIQIAQIWDNGTLVRNMVPAKNSSGVIGMYDTVNNVFYTNQGTGEFTAGPVVPENPIKIATTAYNSARFSPVVTDLNTTIATIRDVVTNTINQTAAIADLQTTKQTRPDEQCPAGKKCLLVETEENGVIVPHWYEIIENIYGLPAGYTALEYIEGTGTQYIDTGLKLNQNNIVEVDWMYYTESTITTSGRIFGARYTSGSRNSFAVGSNTGKSSAETAVFGQFDNNSVLASNNIVIGQWNTYKVSADGFYINDIKQGDLGGSTFETPFTVKLFAFEQASSSSATPSIGCGVGRSKQFKVWNGDTLVMNLIPAKNSSNIVGMYDTVNGVFYQNAGTGTFTAGPEI